MPGDKGFLQFRPTTEPHGFIKSPSHDIFIDPVGDRAREMSGDGQKSDAKLQLARCGFRAGEAEFVETDIEPKMQRRYAEVQSQHGECDFFKAFEHGALFLCDERSNFS